VTLPDRFRDLSALVRHTAPQYRLLACLAMYGFAAPRTRAALHPPALGYGQRISGDCRRGVISSESSTRSALVSLSHIRARSALVLAGRAVLPVMRWLALGFVAW
jgi:hypothetical protein